MLKPYDLLEGVLNEIEKCLKQDLNDTILAKKFLMSNVHLRRMFKFAFGRTIAAYIRSRKLAASIEDLLRSDMTILDIAMEYGLDYEQTYIRAFKREFGVTPGELRKTGKILKITPPLQLFDSNRLENGVIFGPEIVIIPQFYAAGKKSTILFRNALTCPQKLIDQFEKERLHIPNAVNPDLHINISGEAGMNADYCYFMPAIQVNSFDNIPEQFDRYTFPTSLCARFRFIGQMEENLNMAVADTMFNAIDDFMGDEHQRYFLERKRLNIDIFDSSSSDNCFWQWEWFAPVKEKTLHDIPVNPDGIITTYKQELPAMRFIGKVITLPSGKSEPMSDSVFDDIHAHLEKWLMNSMFDAIEKNTNRNLKTLYKGSGAYICLMRINSDGFPECYLGMFMPKGTKVPGGYLKIDFPASSWGLCSVYGKKKNILHYDAECRTKLSEEGIFQTYETETQWFFQRFDWHRFFEEDRYGKRLIEYCYLLKD